MDLEKNEKALLRALLKKEIELFKKDKKAVMEVNSPFLGEEVEGDQDISFMKGEAEYEAFLKQLLEKVK